MKKIGVVICSLLVLSACSDEKKRLEGDRQSIVEYTTSIQVDSTTQGRDVTLTQSESFDSWTQASGNPSHALPPLAFANQGVREWDVSIGTGSRDDARLLATPVVANGRVFTLDTYMRLRAFNEQTGQQIWERELSPDSKSDRQPGGGIAYENGTIFVSSPYAEVLAISAETGETIWHEGTEAPIRATPTVADGRVFILSINNQLDVFEANTGKRLWSHAGITEHAGLLGTASPAVSHGVVVVAYSSGEVYALKAETGYELWSDTLSPTRRPDSLSSLAHIKAHPIIDGDLVIVVGHNQKMAALDIRTGQRVWERRIGGIHTPSVTSDYIFLVNNFNELVCLTKNSGEVVWIEKLPIDKKNPNRIMWSGPRVAGEHLYLPGINGEALVYSPKGEKVKTITLHEPTILAPVVTNERMLFLTDTGRLISYK